jgi:hypothetical protein
MTDGLAFDKVRGIVAVFRTEASARKSYKLRGARPNHVLPSVRSRVCDNSPVDNASWSGRAHDEWGNFPSDLLSHRRDNAGEQR